MGLFDGCCAAIGQESDPGLTMALWARILDPMNPLHCAFASIGGNLIGLVHFHLHLTTRSIHPVCRIEDLFVSENGRGFGAGRALVEVAKEHARAGGCASIRWDGVQADAQSLAFGAAIGATQNGSSFTLAL